jgi:hypothetical protein
MRKDPLQEENLMNTAEGRAQATELRKTLESLKDGKRL